MTRADYASWLLLTAVPFLVLVGYLMVAQPVNPAV